MALNLKTLGTRSISAAFFVIILVGAVWYSYFTCLLLFFIVALLALHEYYCLAQKLGSQPYRITGFLFGILLFAYFKADVLRSVFSFGPQLESVLAALLVIFPSVVLLTALFSTRATNLADALHTLVGVLYAVLPLALLITLPVTTSGGVLHYDYFKILGIIFLIWCNDTLAYLGGSLFGKNKMYKRISPGKTWEGTLTGALGAIGLGFVLNLDHTYEQSFIWPCIGLLVAAFGTMGDLVESMLKRQAGVKDSGRLMPGHGGALDRFDSLIFVTPFVYAFLKLLGVV